MIGSVVAVLSSGVVLPLIFGIKRVSPSSLWMLAGVLDFLTGLVCLPVFWVAHGLIYLGCKKEKSSIPGMLVALFVFWVMITVVWSFRGGEPVLKSR